jgi:hypothetical protein
MAGGRARPHRVDAGWCDEATPAKGRLCVGEHILKKMVDRLHSGLAKYPRHPQLEHR